MQELERDGDLEVRLTERARQQPLGAGDAREHGVAMGVQQLGCAARVGLLAKVDADRLAQGPLTIPEAVTLTARAAEALSAAHQRGIVHRDIKPSNMFLVGGQVDRLKLLDFGVARLVNAVSTRSGMVVGTPGYMAPEQARGEPRVDARADIFSLGCVLFECLTGRPAFSGEHVYAVLAKQGVEAKLVYPECCGMPQFEDGELSEVAERAGHSVDVLLKVYAKCLDGDRDRMNARIAAALAG